ncbi:hypothetical protein GXW74_14635 [Roseomonas eburnea]|uniref:Uncharacterized protein n=1 Tax=Neoroseomonas eburnea TaxID=1346889 RepID=A0A9X9XDE2_9PROT|nr:hypothetical protein [Neoroseomonas eburnea]MBR0681728.1 hypothetical protein [Neoroseomonas eburnea]
MTSILRRRALLTGAAAGLLAPRATRAAAEVPVGAIRWDAWQVPGSAETRAVERSLSPPEYRARLPFFAELAPDGTPHIDGGRQEVMDREIALARRAGLGFFAFVAYPEGSAMGRGLDLFLASRAREGFRFCLVCELRNWGTAERPAAILRRHAALMRHPDHLRLGGRPVYFLGFITPELVEQRWGGIDGLAAQVRSFRAGAREEAGADPLLVLMVRRSLAGLARRLGADALGAYTHADGEARGASYAALAALAEARWREQAATGLRVLPTAMAGWDRRPRVANPVPWEAWQRPGAGLDRHYLPGSAEEIAAHVARCRDWAARSPASAGACLVYAWNENDEGGWLVPTLPFDDARIEALARRLSRGTP